MAHFGWGSQVTEAKDYSYGYGITGFETAGTALANSGTVSFVGKGIGRYYSITDFGNKYFDVTANVDFGARTVNLISKNTCINNYGCDDSDRVPHLDFTGKLAYDANSNALNTSHSNGTQLTTAGDTKNASLTGTADARFYGTGTHDATEFGGTFNLSNSEAGYVGWFGAKADIYSYVAKTSFDTATTSHADLPKTFATSKDNFDDAFAVTTEESLTGLKAFGVERFIELTHIRDASKSGTAWDSADITPGSTPATTRIRSISDAVFDIKIESTIKEGTLYFGENKLHSDSGGSAFNRYYVSGDINDGTLDSDGLPTNHQYSTASVNTLNIGGVLGATASNIGFTSKYITFITWGGARQNDRLRTDLTQDTTYRVAAHAVAGFETDIANIPTTAITDFNGNSRGVYSIGASGNDISSDIAVAIDFAEKTAQFTSNNACETCSGGGKNLTTYAHLNFTTEKTLYGIGATAGKNQIFANAFTEGDGSNAAMRGMVEARFYGNDGDKAKELGGIFAFQGTGINSSNSYRGYFGTARDYVAAIDRPTTSNANNLTGFNDSNRANKTNNTLKVGSAVEITKTSGGTVTNNNITGAVAEFDYQASGDFANDGLRLYFDDKKYSTSTSGSGSTNSVLDNTSPIADGGDAPTEIGLTKQSSYFGFTPEYMALTYWTLDKTGYDSFGFGITGYETTTILKTGTVSFTGKGQGRYIEKSSAITANLYFDVTAAIDFAMNKVTLTSDKTCSASPCPSAQMTSLSYLNFTGELTYAADTNNISGNVETAGDAGNNIAKMTGTAYAKFYGPAATEFGGTFNLDSAKAGYVGYFGASREFYTFPDTTTPYKTWATSGATDGATTFNGLSYYADSDKPTTQTFEVTQSGNKITEVKIKTLDSNGNVTATDDFDARLSTGHRHINDTYQGLANLDNQPGTMRILKKSGSNTSFVLISPHPDHATYASGWQYQTVGVTNDGTGKRGGFSTGSFTNDIPTSGSASFTGRAYGYYKWGGSSQRYITRADASIAVNFGAGTAAITTTNSRRVEYDDSSDISINDGDDAFSSFANAVNASDAAFLDFTGTLTYDANNKWFRGEVNATMFSTGDAVMKAYGPNAEEMGGVFNLESADGSRKYAGAFGAKKD